MGVLVLDRRPGERFTIGGNVEVVVIRVNSHSVKLGIDAPRDVPIVRDDVAKRADRHRRATT